MTVGPRVLRDDAAGIAAAVDVLRAGGIVALPTDTVYGIAVALDTPGGIERLFAVKERPPEKGIALLLAGTLQAWHVGVPTAEARRLATACWPGPLTLVLERAPGLALPDALTGGAATVGVRVPDHATPRALAGAVGPLPTTSANLSGASDAFDAAAVIEQFGDRIDLVLDGGRSGGAAASTVVDCTRDPVAILREGVLGERRIREILA
jgi:L-threonylcarbamoyladenylate synthase